VRGLAAYGDLVEFNVSSPNTKLVYGWSTRPRELRAMLEAVRAAADKPLLSPPAGMLDRCDDPVERRPPIGRRDDDAEGDHLRSLGRVRARRTRMRRS